MQLILQDVLDEKRFVRARSLMENKLRSSDIHFNCGNGEDQDKMALAAKMISHTLASSKEGPRDPSSYSSSAQMNDATI